MPLPRVALVYPYFRTRSANEILFPPLGAATLAGHLRTLGVETRIFDGTFDTFEGVLEQLIAWRPAVVGIYSMVTLSHNAFRITARLRESLPDSLLVAGGPLPTLYPDQYTAQFDMVFRGEVDLSFPRFCHDYLDQRHSRSTLAQMELESYPGCAIHQGGLLVNNPVVHYSQTQISAFPLADRGDFDHAAYQDWWQQNDGTKTTSIITTFGCPFSCDFCSRPIFGSKFRRRDLDSVFTEIAEIRRLGYDCLWIADDNFTLDIRFLRQFCERMTGLGIQWTCLSRVTGVDSGIAAMMKTAGCRRVYLGLETGNPDTLKLMKKRATLEEGRQAVHLFHQAGIETAAFFIVGYPGETAGSIEDTFRYALDLPLDDISFNVPFPLPGSPLFDRIHQIEESRDWDIENEVTFVYDSEFDPGWLRQRIDQTLKAFADLKLRTKG